MSSCAEQIVVKAAVTTKRAQYVNRFKEEFSPESEAV